MTMSVSFERTLRPPIQISRHACLLCTRTLPTLLIRPPCRPLPLSSRTRAFSHSVAVSGRGKKVDPARPSHARKRSRLHDCTHPLVVALRAHARARRQRGRRAGGREGGREGEAKVQAHTNAPAETPKGRSRIDQPHPLPGPRPRKPPLVHCRGLPRQRSSWHRDYPLRRGERGEH